MGTIKLTKEDFIRKYLYLNQLGVKHEKRTPTLIQKQKEIGVPSHYEEVSLISLVSFPFGPREGSVCLSIRPDSNNVTLICSSLVKDIAVPYIEQRFGLAEAGFPDTF